MECIDSLAIGGEQIAAATACSKTEEDSMLQQDGDAIATETERDSKKRHKEAQVYGEAGSNKPVRGQSDNKRHKNP